MNEGTAARSDVGGSAGAGGFRYQARVTAWFAVAALAGRAAAPVEGLWSGAVLRIACETGDPVDDCRVETEGGAGLAIQAKRSLFLSKKGSSELAKTVGQFVRQHLATGRQEDQLVLVTTSEASGTVTNDLRKALARRRRAAAGTEVDALGLSDKQRAAHNIFVDHAKAAWNVSRGTAPTLAELDGLLRRCHVLVLDVEPGLQHEREAMDRLRTMVLADPDDADSAWQALLGECSELAIERADTDQERLQRLLTALPVRLATTRDYRADVARLVRWTRDSLDRLNEGLTTLPTPRGGVAIDRVLAAEIIIRAREESFLVEGDPGTGKTVILRQLAESALETERPVLFVALGGLTATSTGTLRTELGLEHFLLDVLAQWSPGGSGLLVIDALDAARADAAADLWRSIVAELRERLPRWRVVASIRSWDLLHSRSWRRLFPAQAVRVDELSDPELDEAGGAHPDLATLLARSAPAQSALLRNPFNLRLAAELLIEGIGVAELAGAGSGLDLLERYWDLRVLKGEGGFARVEVLRRLCASAVAERRLAVPASRLIEGDTGAERHLRHLLSGSVLVHAPGIGGAAGVGPVQFAHHLLFDYAVAVAYLIPFSTPSSGNGLDGALAVDPDLVLFARPSISIYLSLEWAEGPAGFGSLAERLAGQGLPAMARTAVADVIVRYTESVGDLEPLLARAAEGTQGSLTILDAAAVAVSLAIKDAVSLDRTVWAAVAERLSRSADSAGSALGTLVTTLAKEPDALTPEALASCGTAARRLLEQVWAWPPSAAARLAIEAVIATSSADVAASSTLLRRMLEPGQLRERGYNDLLALTMHLPRLIEKLPMLVPELYLAVLTHEEGSTERTSMGPGVVLSLSSTRRQDFDHSKYELVQAFPDVLRWNVGQALTILTDLLQDEAEQRFIGEELRTLLDHLRSHASHADAEATRALVEALTTASHAASVWRSVREAASDNPILFNALPSRPGNGADDLVVPEIHEPEPALDLGWSPSSFRPSAPLPEADGAAEQLRSLLHRLKEFNDANLNGIPEATAVNVCQRTVRALLDALEQADAMSRAEAENAVARAAEIWTRDTEAPAEVLEYAREILLTAATSLRPEPTPHNVTFDALIPQGPRGDAARGLLRMGRMPRLYEPSVAEAVRRLARDPVEWVRYCVASDLGALRESDPELAWSLLDAFATQDDGRAVLAATARSVAFFIGDGERGITVLRKVADRVEPGGGHNSPAAACAAVAATLWVHRATPGADAALYSMIDNWPGIEAWSSCVHDLRESRALTHPEDAVRRRVWDLLTRLSDHATTGVRGALDRIPPDGPETDRLKSELRLLDGITFQLYVSSGASKRADGPPTTAQLRLVDEARPLLKKLAAIPVAGMVHRLIEIYDHVLDQQPEQALLAVREVLTQAGRQSGYTGDQFGIDACVRFVERVLADHRGLLHVPGNLTAVREICDAFIDAGWPQAHRLVYGIARIFH